MYNRSLYLMQDGGQSGISVANDIKKNMTLKIVQAAKSYFDDDPDIKVCKII